MGANTRRCWTNYKQGVVIEQARGWRGRRRRSSARGTGRRLVSARSRSARSAGQWPFRIVAHAMTAPDAASANGPMRGGRRSRRPSVRKSRRWRCGADRILAVAGLPALWGGESGQVRKEAATAIFRKCRGLGSPHLPALSPRCRRVFSALPVRRLLAVAAGRSRASFCAPPLAQSRRAIRHPSGQFPVTNCRSLSQPAYSHGLKCVPCPM